MGSIPRSGRSPGDRSGNPLQYSCLEDSMVRGAWRASVDGVAKSQMRPSDLAHTRGEKRPKGWSSRTCGRLLCVPRICGHVMFHGRGGFADVTEVTDFTTGREPRETEKAQSRQHHHGRGGSNGRSFLSCCLEMGSPRFRCEHLWRLCRRIWSRPPSSF